MAVDFNVSVCEFLQQRYVSDIVYVNPSAESVEQYYNKLAFGSMRSMSPVKLFEKFEFERLQYDTSKIIAVLYYCTMKVLVSNFWNVHNEGQIEDI